MVHKEPAKKDGRFGMLRMRNGARICALDFAESNDFSKGFSEPMKNIQVNGVQGVAAPQIQLGLLVEKSWITL